VLGGGSDVSYNFGGGYSHTGDYIPNGEISRQSNPSAYGGMRFARGIVTADVTGRYYVQDTPQVFDPAVTETGFVPFSKPFYEPTHNQAQTLGARLTVAPVTWWHHTITAGIDRYTSSQVQTQPRLTTPSDTLLTVSNSDETKTSIGYNTSVEWASSAGMTGSLTVGFDHYSLPLTFWGTSGAVNTTGGIATDPNQPVSAYRTVTNNTGYFAQAQFAVHDALFLTGGLRAEQNSEFGDSLGTPLSPQVGLSYIRSLGGATLKLRGSWGRAIRPPSPGLKGGSVSAGFVTLASPRLGPERQRGGDVGVDAVFGLRGSLSVTYYNQTAEDLIDYVQVQLTPVPTYQYQNVGRIKNTGVEIEAKLNAGPVQLKGQYGYVRSRVEELAPNYAGDLQVGDQVLATPKHTAGGSLSAIPVRGTTVTAGLTYVGSWNQYNSLAIFRCFGGTGPCQPTNRDYIAAFPAFVRVNATVSQQLTPFVSAFASVDNVTNNTASEFYAPAPRMGRITTLGIQFHH
jgi:outer membrane receptor protein involved in Fe transport